MLIRLATGLVAIVRTSWRVGRLAGPAKVIDGDTLVVAGELVRLHGLDAPELDQTFWWRGERIACGMMAMAALEALTAGIQVRCRAVERDRHGRLFAKIFSPDGIDIGRRLVLAGWALAYRQYSTDYVDAEAEARRARRGLWRGTFAKPGEWRSISARVRPPPSTAPRTGGHAFLRRGPDGFVRHSSAIPDRDVGPICLSTMARTRATTPRFHMPAPAPILWAARTLKTPIAAGEILRPRD